MKNKTVQIVAGAVIILIISFYAGNKYGQRSALANRNVAAVSSFGQGGNRALNGAGGIRSGQMMNSTPFSGQVISKESTGITIELAGGGSKIIFISSSTPIAKITNGSISDIAVDSSVTVSGSQNSDGTVTARTVQIRSGLPAGR